MGQKLYSGRFTKDISPITTEITQSISYDRQLYAQDLAVSRAHARMLYEKNILSEKELASILKGLELVEREIEEGKLVFKPELEDIHTHIENRLCELIGEDGKKLHTARSRNDQVAADTHLYLLQEARRQKKDLVALLETILDLAEKHKTDLWIAYTHLQVAQPVLLSHYLLSYFWAFHRDLGLLDYVIKEADRCPLGAAAVGGPNYAIEPELTARLLGFQKTYENSLDAVANRDYQLNYHFFASRLCLHVSRLCEDLIIYNSLEFGYVQMDDEITTGSSIMPQKRNPDLAEILRSRSARASANLLSLMMNLKGLPASYNRDLQEDKIYLFDNIKLTSEVILGTKELLEHTRFLPEKVEINLEKGFAQATDIADYLVSHYGLPFRQAHELTANLVRYCEQQGKTLRKLTLEEIQEVWPQQYQFDKELLDLTQSPRRRGGSMSTHPNEVEKQLEKAKQSLIAHL
ncbi:MAG: argininosuccinate lyase [Leptospiraceae bacterium]|nr:argininosuccinate lyase [Leptospiraceae bacterium]MDW8306782.1 argininosuccinate lyase [Leptospiraceae bacterium]